MIHRRVISVGSLISGLVAFYLHLYKYGYVSSLACTGGPHGCEYVQNSAYGTFMGRDVALLGTWMYAAIFVVATIGALERFADAKWPTYMLMGLIVPGFLFTLRLKYYEYIVLGGFCIWCLVNAITITVCTVMVILDYRRLKEREVL
jgi:uncharacterized membrane protein